VVSRQEFLAVLMSYGLGLAVSDFNLDGYPDIYVE
jgi:hypothetical protein